MLFVENKHWIENKNWMIMLYPDVNDNRKQIEPLINFTYQNVSPM